MSLMCRYKDIRDEVMLLGVFPVAMARGNLFFPLFQSLLLHIRRFKALSTRSMDMFWFEIGCSV